jgi:hypothetical protein
MIERTVSWSLIVLGGLILLVAPTMGAGLNTISQGNTVFIGEQGLDITSAMNGDTQIGWWASGAAIATSSPDAQVVISDPRNFFVLPSQFSSYSGAWYRLNAQGKPDGVAFIVADQSLDIRTEDTTVNVDETDGWVSRGDEVRFRIDTNLNTIYTQRGTAAPITIKVQSPDGGIYSALVNNVGATTTLENIPVTASPFYYLTTPIWDTGNSLYSVGTYTIWAECNANNMKNNYEVAGKTISRKTSVRDQDQNPLISASVPTTIETPLITATPTATPSAKKPTTSPTTVITSPSVTPITTTPSLTATTVPVSIVSSIHTIVESTPTKSPGFGAVLTLVSVCALAAVIVLKKQH